MKIHLTLLLTTIVAFSTASGQFQHIKNTKSNLDFYLTNKGIIFNNDNEAGLRWPRGSSDAYMFGSGLWFAAKKHVAPPPNAVSQWSSAGGVADSICSIAGNSSTRNLIVGTYRNGIYFRSDAATSWFKVALPILKIESTVAVVLPNGKEVAGGDSGLFVGASGSPWTRTAIKGKILCLSKNGVALQGPMTGGTPFNIYTPDDNGTTWTLRHSFSTTSGKFKYLASVAGNKIIAGCTLGVIQFSNDSGVTWTSITAPTLAPITGIALSGSGSTIFISTNNGGNLSNQDGVFRTTDLGVTWVETNKGLSKHHATALSTTDGAMFALGTTTGAYVLPADSLASGGWVDHGAGIPDSVSISLVDIDASGALHVVLANKRIFTEWSGKELFPGWVEVCELGYNPNSGSGWYTGGENTLFKEPADTLGKYLPYLSTSFDTANGTPTVSDTLTPQYRWPVWTDPTSLWHIRKNFDFGSRISKTTDRDTKALSGGTPVFISEEDIVNTYTDIDTTANPEFRPGVGYPLGLNIEESIYTWSFGIYRDLVYIRYHVTNSSADTLKDCFLAPAFDPDLGVGGTAAANDKNSAITDSDKTLVERVLGSIPDYKEFVDDPNRLNMGYQYSGKESGKEYGVLGVAMVETPVVVGKQVIANSDSNSLGGYGPNSVYQKNKLGLFSFRTWTISNDPTNGATRYNFVSESHKDRLQITADVRIMLSVGPFDLMPGESATTTVAIGIAHPSTTNNQENIDSVVKLMAFAHRFFATPHSEPGDPNSVTIDHFGSSGTSAVRSSTSGEHGIKDLIPNPTTGIIVAESLPENIQRVVVSDVLGKVVIDMPKPNIQNFRIDLTPFPAGIYYVKFIAPGSGIVKKVIKQ